ncbi:MAG: hypothetical protein WC781_01745 [Candidatus Pacearchaeota archaeon]|jgi:antitoxin component of MazEF toxin-antitoxin module
MSIQTKVKVKEWGNSLGLIIPNEIVIKEDIQSNDEIIVTISKRNTLEDFFGKANKKLDAQKMKNEARKIWKMD